MFHIELKRKPFLEILTSISGFVGKGDVESVLQQVKLMAKGSELKLSGTNLEVGILSTLQDVTVFQEGSILLPCSKSIQILKESQDEVFVIKEEGNHTVIELDGAKFKLNVGDFFKAEDAPEFAPEEGTSFEMASERLEEMIAQVNFCCAKEASRYVLNGILFHLDKAGLTLVTTDGKRLAQTIETSITPQEESKVIVPDKGLLLLKSIPNKPERVKISFTNYAIWFNYVTSIVRIKLLEGRFPKYQDVLPKNNPEKVTLNTKEFLSKVKQTALMTNDKSRVVRMLVLKDRVELSAHSSGIGEASVAVSADYLGDGVEMGFNPDYLSQLLSKWNEEEVTLKLKDEETAIIVEGVGTVYLIMPVSLKS